MTITWSPDFESEKPMKPLTRIEVIDSLMAENKRIRKALEEVVRRECCPDARNTSTMGPFMLEQSIAEAKKLLGWS